MEGCTCVVNSVTSRKQGQSVAAQIGNGSIYVQADCSTEEGCAYLVSKSME